MADLEQTPEESKPLSPREVLRRVRELGLETPAEAVQILRRDRDAR
jgi:hypothetical protein